MLVAAAVAVATGIAVLASVGRSGGERPPAAARPLAPPQTVPSARLRAGEKLTRTLPRAPWLVSVDVRLVPGARVVIVPGSARDRLTLTVAAGGVPSANWRGRTYALPKRPGWGAPSWRHVELRGGSRARMEIDAQPLPAGRLAGRKLSFSAGGTGVQLAALLISRAGDRASLPLHRLAELHARLAVNAFPLGADGQDQLHFETTWSNGFWPEALWQAAALDPDGGMFAGWALRSTVVHLGQERTAVHDVGFMYGQSSLSAWRALCKGRSVQPAICPRLERSALSVADELEALARTNPGAGTIPTSTSTRHAETIIDSMMNILILTWATRVTHRPDYARLALHQAHVIAALLVRPDGSTAQSVHFDRSTGRITFLGTSQGLRADSTWSRGEGWGLYGFAQMAADLHNPGLLAVAQSIGGYVARNLPSDAIPRWDYDAPAGAPPDVSAGAITAAGMFHLASACRMMPDTCSGPGQWSALGSRMLSAVLSAERVGLPLGYLGGQVYDERTGPCWCNGGELTFGLTYTLEALNLQRLAGL